MTTLRPRHRVPHRCEQVVTLEIEYGRIEPCRRLTQSWPYLRSRAGFAAVQRIAGKGTSDTRWKGPGMLDWSTGIYNPCVDITQDTTAPYASDRDVFLFLVDDPDPIEAGAAIGRQAAADLVRAVTGAAAGLVRRDLDASDERAEGEGGRGLGRCLWFPDMRTERAGEDPSPEGYAGDPEDIRGGRPVDERADRAGVAVAAATSGWRAGNRRAGR
jgi:hypothetical protein